MDKYTVDLDQVLNDFEYSELTDQQSKNASERPHSTTPFQPTPITKHSINNVFHSLNEYLSSEIGSSSDKVRLQDQNAGFEPIKLGKNDNNVCNNVAEVSDLIKTELNVDKNQPEHLVENLDTFVDLSEHLPEPKDDSQTQNALDTTWGDSEQNNVILCEDLHINNTRIENKVTDDSINISSNENRENIQTDLLHIVNNIPDSMVNAATTSPHEKNTTKSNDILFKTDNINASLLDAEINGSNEIPKLNCTEKNVNCEVTSVDNDKDCDKIVDNKADSKIGNSGKNESLEGLNVHDTTCIVADNIVNISEIIESSGNSSYESAEVINEKLEENPPSASEILENVENFIIEPSESVYALGIDDTKITEINENLNKVTKNILLVERIEEPTAKNNEEQFAFEEKHDIGNADKPQTISLSEETTPHNNTNINQNSSLIETTEYMVEDISKDINDKLGESEPKSIIGFAAELDIDDNELNKMLEDLEIEESDLNKEKIQFNLEEQPVVKNDEVFEEKAGMIRIDSHLDVEKITDEPEHDVNSKDVNNVASCQLPPNHEEIHLEKPKEDTTSKDIGSKVIECLEIEKPSKNKKSAKKIPNDGVGVTAGSKEQENTKDIKTGLTETAKNPIEVPQEVKDKIGVVLQTQKSQDSLNRPQDLPLNNEGKEGNPVRKIDLIGSPGSTPYNNVYINKSIDPKTIHDTDSDCTSSVSPTFSDCSTESTSTASTVSVEDLPKNPDNVSTKTRVSEKRGAKKRTAEHKGESNKQENASNPEGTQDTERESAAVSDDNPSSAEQNVSNTVDTERGDARSTESFLDKSWLGKEAPLWIPDSDAASCLHCDMKFTVIKRRHHCRACGLVLCSKCCNLKFRLEYLDAEARVCNKCHDILNKDSDNPSEYGQNPSEAGDSPAFRPNPNNPLEYCSTVSPLQQIGATGAPPPSVMVPVGVLKRKGSNKKSNKSVMFCDGIAPGSDLTNLDQDFNYHEGKTMKSAKKVTEEVKKKDETPAAVPAVKSSRNLPKIDQETGCFIPKSETSLPPTVCVNKTDILYSECSNSPSVVEMLKNESLTFAINQNLYVKVKVINMKCCINKQAWCFSTNGLIYVGSDEIVYLIEYIDEESFVPKDIFFHIYNVYADAVKGTSVKELGLSLHNTSNFLDSKNHAGFVYIRPTFQCLENVLKPDESYLVGILIHRWETPWAKLFPLRLILRLGAEYRYYPSPLISTRHRDSVFVEIGHTIINLLADFRNFSYSLPQIRGLIIHMEDKKTTIMIPKNRYDQVMKSINNSSEHILAFAGNFSPEADSHLVCIQDTQGNENSYTTHAINIHNKPRKVTGASFIVFNGSLKSSSGLTAKSNIVEDGLMIQIPSEHMDKIREDLRNMKNHVIACGCINATSDETVNIIWGENDSDFNIGVKSPVDLTDMKGVPSIRVHNGKDYFCNNGTRLIRWTEVFILQNGEENPKNQDPVDISKVSESISKACCTALIKYLDLLVSNSCQKIGIRVTLHVENVSYLAGSNGLKLPPIYMRSLDNELVPVLHRITSNNLGDNAIVLELIFRILNA